jgi:2-keto-4-pentenoate hydratase
MTPDQYQDASNLLYRHWQNGTQLDGLPENLRPHTRAEGYAIQACIEAHTTAPLAGWKIAATSIAGQKHIGVDGPMAGRLLAERAIPNGGDCALGNNLMKVAELEFAFRMGRDLPPRETPYTQDDVMDAVEALLPAIEIPDSRYAGYTNFSPWNLVTMLLAIFTEVPAMSFPGSWYPTFETAGAPQLIADNACAHRYLFGADVTADWRGIDLAAHVVRAFRDGAHVEDGVGANVLGDPRIAVTWLANELSAHGLALKAGQTVITGTCVKPLAIAVGMQIEGDFGLLGQVSIRIV